VTHLGKSVQFIARKQPHHIDLLNAENLPTSHVKQPHLHLLYLLDPENFYLLDPENLSTSHLKQPDLHLFYLLDPENFPMFHENPLSQQLTTH